jgi:hypothetical protein
MSEDAYFPALEAPEKNSILDSIPFFDTIVVVIVYRSKQ